MKIKKHLKVIRNKLKDNIRYTSLIYDYINLIYRYLSENKLLKKIATEGGIVLSAEDLHKNMRNESCKVCHIIGLGWSLNDSMSRINRANSYIIGMNNGALSGLEFDL